MKKIVTTSLLIVLIFVGCENKKENKAKAMQIPPQMVTILKAKKSDENLTFTYPARIVSAQDIKVRSKISGTILKQYFTSGQKVKKGDTLFKIDAEVYTSRYNIQLANVEVAKANFNKTAKDLKRVSSLHVKKATSQKNYDEAISAYQIAKANLAQARASLRDAKINVNYTNITAPFDGIAGDNLVDVGDFIPANTPLVRLTSSSEVYAEFFIPDVEILKINQNTNSNLWTKKGSKVTIKYQDIRLDGSLDFIDKVIDTSTGQIKAKAKFKDEKNLLPIGSFVDIELNGIAQKSAFKVPQVALQQNLATTVLYVVALGKKQEAPKGVPPFMIPDGVITAVPVKIDYSEKDYALISGDIKEGDAIITNNFKKIYPGAKVKITGEFGKTKAEKK